HLRIRLLIGVSQARLLLATARSQQKRAEAEPEHDRPTYAPHGLFHLRERRLALVAHAVEGGHHGPLRHHGEGDDDGPSSFDGMNPDGPFPVGPAADDVEAHGLGGWTDPERPLRLALPGEPGLVWRPLRQPG